MRWSSAARAAIPTPPPGQGVPPPVVDVLSRGSVGPYEYVVVRSEDGATLRTWLATNGYYVSEDGGRIVDEYVASGHSFVAVKLQLGAGHVGDPPDHPAPRVRRRPACRSS